MGSMKNRRRVVKLGPLFINDQDQRLTKAFRNISEVYKLDPDGHL